MATKRNTSGLKRGGITPEARNKGLAAAQRSNAEKKKIVDAVAESPYAAYDEMHRLMTEHQVKLLKQEKATGQLDRNVTERMREYRQLTAELNAYLQAKGADDEAHEFFSMIDSHLESANFYEASPEGPPAEAVAAATAEVAVGA